jgi:hypothetical protein
VLIENSSDRGHGIPGALNHLGIEVDTPEEVRITNGRLSTEGLQTEVLESTTCCYALQDKTWVSDPDGAPWEIDTVLADVPGQTGPGCSVVDGVPASTGCC